MPGWGAYVPEKEYQSHIANYVDQPEVRVQYGCEETYKHLYLSRSIHASPRTTRSSELVPGRYLVMLSRVRF